MFFFKKLLKAIILTIIFFSTSVSAKTVIVGNYPKRVPSGKKWKLEVGKAIKIQVGESTLTSGALCNALFLSRPGSIGAIYTGSGRNAEPFGIVFNDIKKVPYTNNLTFVIMPTVFQFVGDLHPTEVKKLEFTEDDLVFVGGCLQSIELMEVNMTQQEIFTLRNQRYIQQQKEEKNRSIKQEQERKSEEQRIREERITQENKRLEEEQIAKEKLNHFLHMRRTQKYNYFNYNKSHLNEINETLEKSLFDIISQSSNNLESTSLNLKLHIDTNSLTTYSLQTDKPLPTEIAQKVNALLKDIKLQPCLAFENYTVNAETQLVFKLNKSIKTENYKFSYFKDGIFIKKGIEADFQKQKVSDDLKQKNYAYGKYHILYTSININNKKSEDIKYLSHNGLGGTSSALLSVFIPGLGNKLVSQKSKSPWYINTIGILGLAGTGVYYKMESDDNYSKYQSAVFQKDMDKYYDEANKQHAVAYTLMGAAAVWWIYDIINVGVKGSKNTKENHRMKNERFSTRLAPFNIHNTYGLALQVKF